MLAPRSRQQLPRVIGNVVQATSKNPAWGIEDFYNQYPQFFAPPAVDEETGQTDPPYSNPLVPTFMLQDIINLAHASLQFSVYREAWLICMGLFVAHFATLYLQTMNDPLAGDTAGLVASKSVDSVSVSYDNSAITADLQGFGEFKATTFGLQLATYAKMMTTGGLYVR